MTSHVIVRSQGPAREYFRTVAGALARAVRDAETLGCEPVDAGSFVGVIEEGRCFRLVGPSVTVEFRAAPLGE